MVRRLAILAVLGAAVVLTAALSQGSPRAPVAQSSQASVHLRRYRDAGGWSLTYPSDFHLERTDSGPGRVEFTEITLANFVPRRGVKTGTTSDGGFISFEPPAKPFPADGVALRIAQIEGGPLIPDTGPDSRFPLTLSTFTGPDRDIGVAGGRSRTIVANGRRYTAIVLVGRHAPARLRAALAGIVASLGFRPQRPGTTVDQDVRVLQTPAHYPPGSFTLIHVPGEVCGSGVNDCHAGIAPMYLVNAAWHLAKNVWRQPCGMPAAACVPMGSFYVLGWKAEQVEGGYTSRCQMRLDRRRRQFYCANFDARWDRFGRTLRRPRWAHVNDDLAVSTAKVSWDGFVVL
jgi:hypothetical protein